MGIPKYISPEEAAAAAAAAAQGAGDTCGEAAATAARALADMMGGGLDANAAAIANAAPRARPAWMAGDAAAFTGDQASEVLPDRCALRTRHCHGTLVGSLEALAMDSDMAVLGLPLGSMPLRLIGSLTWLKCNLCRYRKLQSPTQIGMAGVCMIQAHKNQNPVL